MPTDFQKAKRRVKLANGNWSKPISYLTSSESVEMTDGSNLQTTINNKVDKVTGKDLSTNDYTDADKIAVSSLGTASTKDVGTANGVAELDSNGKVPSSQLPFGETSSTAYRGDRGKTAYDHSQTTGNPHGTTKNDIGLGNVNNTADLDKPISTATQTELDKKETIQSSSINMQKNYQYTGHYGVKNLIELTVEKIKELNGGESTWNGNSKTISGLTYTIITDENNNVSGIMASGTYTGTNDYCRLVVFKDFEAHSNLYTINNYDGNIELEIISTNGTIYYSEGVVQQGRSIDIGNSDLYFNGELRIPKNITVSDSIAKPMIRPYVVTSPTFEPYAKSNQQLTHDLSTSLTATGNPLTIESSESNLVECTAEVEAVQDLHGYDHPWVGGAGKNLLPVTLTKLKSANTLGTWSNNAYTYAGITYTANVDSNNNVISITVNGTVPTSGDTSVFVLGGKFSNYLTVNTQYTINGMPSGATSQSVPFMQIMNLDSYSGVANVYYNASGVSYTHTSNYDNNGLVIRCNQNVTASSVVFYPMIRLSTETDSSFAPYTNICPISGRSEVAIQRVGKNLINNTATTTTTGGVTYTVNQDKTISCSNTSTGTSNITIISNATLKAGNYILTGCPNGGGMETMRLHAYRTNGGYLGFDIGSGAEFTLENDINDLNVEIRIGSGVNTNGKIFKPMIRLSTDTDSTYEPYKGKTYTIQLGDTIYGGELDVVTGEMVVDRGIVTLNGSEANWYYSSSYGGYAYNTGTAIIMPNFKANTTVISDKLKAGTVSELTDVSKTNLVCLTSVICVKLDSSYDTVDKYLAWLSSNNSQVCYELATPYTIQLTPQQIRLLKGTNNLSCNTGDLSIKYYPDNVLGQLKGDIESEYDARLERLEQYTDVFGFIEDMDVLSPTERIKYIGKNENYEPLTVDLNTGSYTLGDWGNFPFLVDNKPYMVKPDGTPDYQLNEYDYTKKLDGTDSDVANEDYDGGAFSWGRKIYKKQWMVGNKRYVLYSFDKKDGFHADGFINKDGKELDGRWIPMFYGTVVDGKAKSIATGNCISSGNITTDAQHNAIIAFDSNANFFGGAFVETLIDLLMMFAKNSDLQAAYGYGNSSGYVNDSSKNYGMLNNAVVNGGQFYGRSGGKTLNKALHSIVLATYNSYMRDPYEVIKNGKVVVSEDYTYDPTSATYTDTGITVPNQSSNAWRYPKKYIAVPRYGSIPDISVGGASTSLGRSDGTYTLANQSGAVIVCLRFGYCGYGAFAGLSCRNWDAAASSTWWAAGFALLLDGSAVA